MVGPSSRMASAEHSMCQPGRPGPHIDSHHGSSRQRRLPEDEVERVALVGVVDVATALGGEREHLVAGVARHRAEVGERRDVEVDATAGLVGVAAVEHHADEPADVGDGRGGPGRRPHRQQPDGAHVVVEAGDLGRGQVEVVDAELAGLPEDRVVDVGDVAHAADLVAEVEQAAGEDVVGDVDGGVAEVGGVVGRDAARVHRDRRTGLEGHHLPTGGAPEAHRRRHPACSAPGDPSPGSGAGSLMPVNLIGDAGLVVHVELEQDGGEGLDRRGEAELAGVERAHVGDLGHQLAGARRGLGVIGADQDVALDRVVEVAQLLGRHVVEGGGEHAVRHGRLDRRRHRAAGRHERLELLADAGEGVGHRDDDLAPQAVGHRDRGLRGAVPRGGQDDEVAGRGRLVVAGADLEVPVGPLAEQLVDLLHGPVLGPRADDDLEADRRQTSRQRRASRAGATQDADAHSAGTLPGARARTPLRPGH